MIFNIATIQIQHGKSESGTMETKGQVTCTLGLIGKFFASSACLEVFVSENPSSLNTLPPFSPTSFSSSYSSVSYPPPEKSPTSRRYISSCLTAVVIHAEATPIGKLSCPDGNPFVSRNRAPCVCHQFQICYSTIWPRFEFGCAFRQMQVSPGWWPGDRV